MTGGPQSHNTVLPDVSAVRAISNQVLSVADSLATIGRPLRLPVASPAPDPFSMRIAAHLTHARSTLGQAACDAADELTRMAEIFIGTAQTMTAVARWTSVGMLGLVAPSAHHPVDFSGRVVRRASPNWARQDTWMPGNADEVLSCAVLLTIGDNEVAAPELALSELEELGTRLRTLGGQLRVAWPGGGQPADTLNKFGEWISNDYVNALQRINDSVRQWNSAYQLARTRVAGAAAAYVAARQSALDGEERRVASEDAQAALNQYATWSLGDATLADFPRLSDGP
ncbi:hypothetical protein [Mycobacterium szulgai]|uniref:Uncharacterized protein n=1 Tax=Mycobacterium szulgai TaxID=1787 RepID=A0A1X2DM20_MYCSZ|nr:hypothetical protein [Mycobacterium szulgai]MCV7074663.1 hypothetical protein [Mycobacterium szulgai]ORW89090.1 hypothetical protein AWC27_13495 [Mycobacterium szulgai]